MKTEEKSFPTSEEIYNENNQAINPFAVISYFKPGPEDDNAEVYSDLGISRERATELNERMEDFVRRNKEGDDLNINWPDAFQELTHDANGVNEVAYVAFTLTYGIVEHQMNQMKRMMLLTKLEGMIKEMTR